MTINTDIVFDDGHGNVQTYQIDIKDWAKIFFNGTLAEAKKEVTENSSTLTKIKIIWNEQNKRIQELESKNNSLQEELTQLREKNEWLQKHYSNCIDIILDK